MIVSSITQTKAEVQKLIKLYNQLQQEAKTADTEEATRKVEQAEKLVSQINTLQSALSKTKVKEFVSKPITQPAATPVGTNKKIPGSELADKKRIEFEERINRIESAQKRTRVQIEQLNRAKAELEHLQVEAENAATVAQKQAVDVVQPQAQKLLKLNEQLEIRNTQYQSLQKELEKVRKQAQKDTDLLRKERDAAQERQKQLEKEKMKLLRYGGDNRGFFNGLAIGAGLGILGLATLAVVIFKTSWLDEVICYLKDYPTHCSFQVSTPIPRVEDEK
jgi:myosin heavy subunit